MARRTTTPTTTNGGKARSATPGVLATGSAKARSAGGIVAEALTAHPDHTAADLAALTGLGVSTVTKALAALEQAGHACRTTPDAQAGTRRPAARWQPVCPAAQRHRPTAKTGPGKTGTGKTRMSPEQPAAQSVQGQPEADTAVPAGEQTTGDSTPARTGRLGKGQLGTLVLEYLIAHSGDDLGPTAIGKTLNRSSGAVANLCGSSLSSATAAGIAVGVGASTSAVARALAELEREGRVVRAAGGRERGRRLPDVWTASASTSASAIGKRRLARGELHEIVLLHLRDHGGVEFGPAQLSKVLGRSAGAIRNALDRLVAGEEIALCGDRPRRYAATAW